MSVPLNSLVHDTITYNNNILAMISTVTTVSLQPVSDTMEGNDALVTVELSPPPGGTSISITVTLGSTDGDASKSTIGAYGKYYQR